MCRYANKAYKPHYVCFACRKQFKRPPLEDVLAQQGREGPLVGRALGQGNLTLDLLRRSARASECRAHACRSAMRLKDRAPRAVGKVLGRDARG